jgi:hypothetical protein
MKKLLIVLAVLAVSAGVAIASVRTAPPVTDEPTGPQGRNSVIFFYDNVEGGNTGWTHGDFTADPSRWHVDTYMAYSGSSWWCGTFEYDSDGGYGNGWTEYLNVPATVVSGYPILDYAYRVDSETDYDYTWVEAESLGAYVNLNKGYCNVLGNPIPWTVATGWYVGTMDNPVKARFKFVSDPAWSDQAGNNTVGGAFACDNVRLYDYSTGTVFFYDDVESGGLCIPWKPGVPAGDYWHIQQSCKSAGTYIPQHVWSPSYPDTSYVPPNVKNWLMAPMVDISAAYGCTMSWRFHWGLGADNSYWSEELYVDGTWYNMGGWGGDICDNYGPTYACAGSTGGVIIDALLPASQVSYRWTVFTDEAGCGPDACNTAGLFVDEYRVWGSTEPSPVESTTWGKVKSLYR